MRCKDASRLLEAWRDGELDESRAGQIAAHVRACESCGLRVRALERVSAALRREFGAGVPADLANRAFRAAMSAKPPATSFLGSLFPLAWPAALAASAAAALLVAWSLSSGPPSDPRLTDPIAPLLTSSSGDQIAMLYRGALGIEPDAAVTGGAP